MGWLSSAWDSVCSFTSGVCSVAKDVFVGVASVASGVLSLARVLPLPPQIEAFFLAVQVIDIVCKALGLLEADETNEDFGGRVLQAEETGIHPEEYPTYLEYVAAIRNVELDPEKSAKYKPEEKMAAGLGAEVILMDINLFRRTILGFRRAGWCRYRRIINHDCQRWL